LEQYGGGDQDHLKEKGKKEIPSETICQMLRGFLAGGGSLFNELSSQGESRGNLANGSVELDEAIKI